MMVAEVLSFISAKGGTGKTVVSASIAQFLADLGKKVLLIDLDAATNGLSLLYLNELVEARESLADKEIPAFGIFEVPFGELPTHFEIDKNVDLIPAVYVMKQTEKVSPKKVRESISDTLSTLRDEYNYIILDSQAGSNTYARIAIESADEVIIVTEFDPISAEGIQRLNRFYDDVLSYEKSWILVNKVLPEFSKSLSEFFAVFRFLSPIPWDIRVLREFTRRKLAIDVEKGNEFTLAIMKTTQSLLRERIAGDIDRWKKEKEEKIRKPIRDQLDTTEREIEKVERARIEAAYRLEDLQKRPERFRNTYMLSSFMIFITIFITAFYLLQLFDLMFSLTMALASVLLFLIFTRPLEERIKKRSMSERIDLEIEIDFLNRTIEDLDERRKKYKTLIESDIEELLWERLE